MSPASSGKSFFKNKKESAKEERKLVTVREEKRHLKRVVKAKPMSRKHMSEALAAPKLTEEDMDITEMVIEKVAAPVAPPRARPSVKLFPCFECGSQIPVDAARCPKCRVLYMHDLDQGQVDELLRVEALDEKFLDSVSQRESAPIIHFDAETGVMHYLEEDNSRPDFSFECSHCGTLVELTVDRCPMCGTRMDLPDTGLVSIFHEMEFDASPLGEADCPYCGEHASLKEGRCSVCGNEVENCDPQDPNKKVRPVLKADNVVFLHLDIMTGEVNFVQRSRKKSGYDQMSIQLDGIGGNGFEQEWSGLSRI